MMTHDIALAIGLIWAMGTIAYIYGCNEKTDNILSNVIVLVLINLTCTGLFSIAYLISYMIARAIS